MARVNFVRWDSKYSVGINSIDEQHKQIIELINEFYTAFVEKSNSDIFLEIIGRMMEYATFHFEYEEKYFVQFNYSDSKAHVAEHLAFVEKAKDFKQQIQEGHTSITFRVISFLKEWLSNHIEVSDVAYSKHFISHGLT